MVVVVFLNHFKDGCKCNLFARSMLNERDSKDLKERKWSFEAIFKSTVWSIKKMNEILMKDLLFERMWRSHAHYVVEVVTGMID